MLSFRATAVNAMADTVERDVQADTFPWQRRDVSTGWEGRKRMVEEGVKHRTPP